MELLHSRRGAAHTGGAAASEEERWSSRTSVSDALLLSLRLRLKMQDLFVCLQEVRVALTLHQLTGDFFNKFSCVDQTWKSCVEGSALLWPAPPDPAPPDPPAPVEEKKNNLPLTGRNLEQGSVSTAVALELAGC